MDTFNLSDPTLNLTAVLANLVTAELARRAEDEAQQGEQQETKRPTCGGEKRGKYDTGMHVLALFIILLISTLACGFPLFKRRRSKSSRPSKIIFYCQHFGTGVLIATAFVHLLPTAFISLTDPCLPPFFTEGYDPLAGLISMIFALAVVWLESYLTTRGAGHSHSHTAAWDDEDETDEETHELTRHAAPDGHGDHHLLQTPANGMASRRNGNNRPHNLNLSAEDASASQGLMSGMSDMSAPSAPSSALPQQPDKTLTSPTLSLTGDEDLDADSDDNLSEDLNLRMDELHTTSDGGVASAASAMDRNPGEPASKQKLPNEEEQKRMMLQCLLLEAGILFHSVFIGMAISVATGPAFVVFLVAIAFHQCFEGLALGSRIAAIHFPRASWQPWFMVLAYGTTTPFGQAIGLVVHNLYDPQSQTGLLMVGIMNAISSGLLIFAGLVQLLAEDFLTEKSYKTLTGKKRTQAFICVVSGATLMSVVGAFA